MDVFIQRIVDTYAECAPTYDEKVSQFPYYQTLKKLVFNFDWTGSSLDLGCGTGLLGQLLHEKGQSFSIMGVDLSPAMTESPSITNYYKKPITIGTIQDVMVQPIKVDHVACFGTLTYLNNDEFLAFLDRALVLAQRSIAFDIEDVPQAHGERMAKDSTLLRYYNHTGAWKAWKECKMPAGWRIVHEEYGLQYHEAGSDVNDTMVRLERVAGAVVSM